MWDESNGTSDDIKHWKINTMEFENVLDFFKAINPDGEARDLMNANIYRQCDDLPITIY